MLFPGCSCHCQSAGPPACCHDAVRPTLTISVDAGTLSGQSRYCYDGINGTVESFEAEGQSFLYSPPLTQEFCIAADNHPGASLTPGHEYAYHYYRFRITPSTEPETIGVSAASVTIPAGSLVLVAMQEVATPYNFREVLSDLPSDQPDSIVMVQWHHIVYSKQIEEGDPVICGNFPQGWQRQDVKYRIVWTRTFEQRTPPSLSMPSPYGTGATYSISYAANGTSPETWRVSAVNVLSGGTGYRNNTLICGGLGAPGCAGSGSLMLGPGDSGTSEAIVRLKTTVTNPVLSADVESGDGVGAVLAVDLAYTPLVSQFSEDGDYWYVDSVTITNGGSGYVVGDAVVFTIEEGSLAEGADPASDWTVSAVDDNGAITEIATGLPGAYRGVDDGVVQSVEIEQGGAYFHATGENGWEYSTVEGHVAPGESYGRLHWGTQSSCDDNERSWVECRRGYPDMDAEWSFVPI